MTTLCDGCNVREPWEHRCLKNGCPCPECGEPEWVDGRLVYPAWPHICIHLVGTTPGLWCGACIEQRPRPAAPGIASCPECKQGKCSNCDGTTWDELADAPASCPCTDKIHQREE